MQLSSYWAFRGFACLRVLFCSPFLKFIWGCFYFFKFSKTLITIKIFSPGSNRHKRKHNSADASGNACYNTTDSTEEVTKQICTIPESGPRYPNSKIRKKSNRQDNWEREPKIKDFDAKGKGNAGYEFKITQKRVMVTIQFKKDLLTHSMDQGSPKPPKKRSPSREPSLVTASP